MKHTLPILPILKSAAAFAVFAALPVGFTACNEDDAADGDSAAAQALTITVADGDDEVELEEGATVGVIAVSDGIAVTAHATVTAQAGGLLANTDSIIAVMQDGVELCAYSPASLWTADTYGETLNFSVPSDQSDEADYESADLMLAPLTAVSDGKAHLVLNHMMARVSIHVTDVTGNYDLTGTTMVMPGRNTTVTADLASATAPTVEGITADINAYMPENTVYRATASAVIAPGTMSSGSRLVDVSIDGETFSYTLYETVEWEAGYEYVYSMRLTSDGLVPYDSYVTGWEDSDVSLTGDADEVFIYGVGDYLLSDGSFVKASRITADEAADVVAVVFSEAVSDSDAAAGYDAYAVGVERVTGVVQGFTDAVGESVTDWASALADLDGRLKTAAMLASDAYGALEDKSATALYAVGEYGLAHPADTTVASGWFVPSIGQMLQLLNNLGEAGLAEDTEVSIDNNNSAIFTSDDTSVFGNINALLTAIGLEELFPVTGTTAYITSSEYNVDTYTNFWSVQTTESDGAWTWGFGKNTQKGSSTGRSLVPCIAVKLPDVE